MLSYCLKCREKKESKNPRILKTKEYCFYETAQFAIVKN